MFPQRTEGRTRLRALGLLECLGKLCGRPLGYVSKQGTPQCGGLPFGFPHQPEKGALKDTLLMLITRLPLPHQ